MADRPYDVLSAAQWQRVEALFPELLALGAPERAAFLDRRCGRAPQVRAELESLLAATAGPFWLDQPVVVQDAQMGAPQATLASGDRIGVWRISVLLGRGGMGEVYRAERVEGGFAQAAAIKLLRIDAVEHAARFEAERRILAQLEHANIARLLDGGIDAAGRAWMAMEYVAGETLDAYCSKCRLDLSGRLALFDQVCTAVSYAHAHLVVHRDLKPGNILVTAEGQVKLLDFGVAKLLTMDAVGDDGQTRVLPLTPAHAAPEQLEGGTITTVTDVYALGVLLYEMLCGQRPWRDETLVAGIAERLVRGEPSAPSTVAASAVTVPPRWLRGDLDAIVMRCLRQQPADRYAGVEALRDDLRRYRARQPVVARRGARGYVLRRWVQRHRLGVGATAAVFLALLVGMGATFWQARIARGQALRAELVKSLVLNVFREGDPLTRAGAHARTPAEMVAAGIAEAGHQLAATPALHADVLDDLGEIQANVGDPAAARATLERALALRQKNPADAMAVATTLRRLARVLIQLDDDAALARAQESLALLARIGQADSIEAARASLLAAHVYVKRKDRERALQLTAAAQQLLEQRLGHDDPETAHAVFRHAQVLEQLRRDQAAATTMRDAVGRMERASGADSARLIEPLLGLGTIVGRLNPADAVPVYERAEALARRQLGARSSVRAAAFSRAANGYRLAGLAARAEPLFTEALASLPPGNDSERGQLLKTRGQLYLGLHRYAEAARDLEQAFGLWRGAQGEKSGLTWYCASLWGSALRELGQRDRAERVQRDALARLQAILGADAYQNALLLDELVTTLTQQGKHAEAVRLARRALELTRRAYPPTHRLMADRHLRLAAALAGGGSPAELGAAAAQCDVVVDIAGKLPADALAEGAYGETLSRACAPLRGQPAASGS